MKKYSKNKNFVPEKFLNKIKLDNNRKEKIIITLFLLLNLYFLPKTLKIIKDMNSNNSTADINIKKQDRDNLKEISKWLNSTFDNNIIEVHITNEHGEIVVDSTDEINKLSLDKALIIKDINLNSDKKYKLGVNLNE